MSTFKISARRGSSWVAMAHGSTSAAAMADQIYRKHSGFIWRLLRARGIPIASIPDVLQDIFLTVLRRLPTYQEMGSIKGWLYTIADGEILQFFRTEGRRERRLALFAQGVVGHIEECKLLEHLKRTEASQLVQRFIDELPEVLREVFLLRCVEGLSGVETARLLNMNINTFYSREAAARERFHAFIHRTRASEGTAS